MKGSFVGSSSPPKSIKVVKRSEGNLEEPKKSVVQDMVESLEGEKRVSQSYREQNERNVVKCRYLYNKLTALGNLEGVPEMIGA